MAPDYTFISQLEGARMDQFDCSLEECKKFRQWHAEAKELSSMQNSECHLKAINFNTGFVWVMENLESHGIFEFHFPRLENHGI